MIRSLVQKLPVMTTPKWVHVHAQPISITDLLDYLVQAIEIEAVGRQIFEIGGADVVSYADLMTEYARLRGLTRRIIPVPVLTPYLSSLWLGLVTPVFARVGRKLIGSLCHRTVVQDPSAQDVFSVTPVGVTEAMENALGEEEQEFTQTHWADSMASGGTHRQWGGVHFGTRLIDTRSAVSPLSPQDAFRPIRRIGGATGWYYTNFLWKIRGALDLVVGGVGMRRGRRDLETLRVGDVLDCWRVEAMEPDRRLRLSADMKLPGRAWLEFEVKVVDGVTHVYQTSIFDPVGLSGLLYWYGIYPLHQIIFSGMLKAVVKQGEIVRD